MATNLDKCYFCGTFFKEGNDFYQYFGDRTCVPCTPEYIRETARIQRFVKPTVSNTEVLNILVKFRKTSLNETNKFQAKLIVALRKNNVSDDVIYASLLEACDKDGKF